MPSGFAWVDFGEQQKRQMLQVIQMFNQPDTRDELGLGAIRDAFGDFFFPGTSTIQTRAKYFLFVPWMYKQLEQQRVSAREVAQRSRSQEVMLIRTLVKDSAAEGVIGREAKDKLQRMPSNIYWSGLRSWGIRHAPYSQQEYHMAFDRFASKKRSVLRSDDGEPIEAGHVMWHPGLPPVPRDFPGDASLQLCRQEAEYLLERVCTRHPESLLAQLLLEEDFVDSRFLWQHPIMHRLQPSLAAVVPHAKYFSLVMHGAALLYNLMLSEQVAHDRGPEWVGTYTNLFSSWATRIVDSSAEIANWSLADFWKVIDTILPQIQGDTRSFVTEWITLCQNSLTELSALLQDRAARELISKREVYLKRSRARLDNAKILEDWQGSAGTAQLEFRWSNAKVHIKDILSGLDGGSQDA